MLAETDLDMDGQPRTFTAAELRRRCLDRAPMRYLGCDGRIYDCKAAADPTGPPLELVTIGYDVPRVGRVLAYLRPEHWFRLRPPNYRPDLVSGFGRWELP